MSKIVVIKGRQELEMIAGGCGCYCYKNPFASIEPTINIGEQANEASCYDECCRDKAATYYGYYKCVETLSQPFPYAGLDYDAMLAMHTAENFGFGGSYWNK